jgi:hypothetical protein
MSTPYADDAGIFLPRKGKFTIGRSKPHILPPQELDHDFVTIWRSSRAFFTTDFDFTNFDQSAIRRVSLTKKNMLTFQSCPLSRKSLHWTQTLAYRINFECRHHTPMTRVYFYQERENSQLEGKSSFIISSCKKVKMLDLDIIRYMVSYVSDLIKDWPERIFSTISHPIVIFQFPRKGVQTTGPSSPSSGSASANILKN